MPCTLEDRPSPLSSKSTFLHKYFQPLLHVCVYWFEQVVYVEDDEVEAEDALASEGSGSDDDEDEDLDKDSEEEEDVDAESGSDAMEDID